MRTFLSSLNIGNKLFFFCLCGSYSYHTEFQQFVYYSMCMAFNKLLKLSVNIDILNPLCSSLHTHQPQPQPTFLIPPQLYIEDEIQAEGRKLAGLVFFSMCFSGLFSGLLKVIVYTLRSVNDDTEGITQEPPMGDS